MISQLLTMKHRGEIVKKVINDGGYSKTRIAASIGYSREHLYNMFKDAELSFEIITKIGKAINHDFSADFNDMPTVVNEENAQYLKTEVLTTNEAMALYSNLFTKYTRLLEDYKNVSDELRILKYKYQSP